MRSVQYAAAMPPSNPYVITTTATNGSSVYCSGIPNGVTSRSGAATLPIAVNIIAPYVM